MKLPTGAQDSKKETLVQTESPDDFHFEGQFDTQASPKKRAHEIHTDEKSHRTQT